MNSSLDKYHFRHRSGFSLVELLMVIGTIVFLVSICTDALSSSSSARLSTGGNLIVDLANFARQNSTSKQVMTALVMVKSATVIDPNRDLNYRAFVIMEKAQGDAGWKPVTGWKLLPIGITVDPAQSSNFINQTPTMFPVPDNLPTCGGSALDVNICAYQVFLPDGRLSTNGIVSTPEQPALYLVEKRKGASPKNYYKVTLNLLTGTSHIERP